MNCPYCYRVGTVLGNVPLQKAYYYIDFLKYIGCTNINITGGEPLLHPFWKQIVKYCFQKGFYVALTTNGLALDLDDEALQFVHHIALPLDGSTAHTNSSTRSEDQFYKALELIDKYKKGCYKFHFKINTVITRYNYSELDRILCIVNDSKLEWKLFILHKKGYFYHFPEEQSIPDFVALSYIEHILKNEHKCTITYNGNGHNVNNYEYIRQDNPMVLNFDGNLYRTECNNDIFLYNIDNLLYTKSFHDIQI